MPKKMTQLKRVARDPRLDKVTHILKDMLGSLRREKKGDA